MSAIDQRLLEQSRATNITRTWDRGKLGREKSFRFIPLCQVNVNGVT
eukprot:COSAG06_NODE_1207_length_10262_cov_14.644396_10_plen_47_part_00